MIEHLRYIAEHAAEAGKRAALNEASGCTLEEDLDRLVGVTKMAIERTEMRWARYVAPDALADAIWVAEGSRRWSPDGKPVLEPHDPESFVEAVEALILIARVAMGDMNEIDRLVDDVAEKTCKPEAINGDGE